MYDFLEYIESDFLKIKRHKKDTRKCGDFFCLNYQFKCVVTRCPEKIRFTSVLYILVRRLFLPSSQIAVSL